MDVDPSDSLPEAEQSLEINQQNDQTTDTQPPLASKLTMTATEVSIDDRQSDGGDGRSLKRPAELLQDKPEVKRRNQRLFGALLGTLQKFKKEEDATQSSAVAQRRAAMLQAAEEKSRKASEQYSERHRHSRLEGNRNRPEHWYSDDVAGDRRRPPRRVPFLLKTLTEPSLSWAPRETCAEIDAMREKQRARSQDVGKQTRPLFIVEEGAGGGNDNGGRNGEGEVDREKYEESAVPAGEERGLDIGTGAEAGPVSSGKHELSDSDDGGGWRTVENPTAEAFR
jgi:pinin/SDK/memA/ protein conserved region